MSLISPSLAQRIEQARQAQLRAQKAAANSGWRPSKSDRKDRYARWHVDETVESDAENWLLSYLDLITLLLAMLVVMLAVSRLHGDFHESGEKQVDIVGSLAAKGLPAYDGEYAEFDTPAIPASWGEPAAPAATATAAAADATPDGGEVVAQAAPPLKAPSKESLGLGDLGKSVDVIINEQSVSFRISNELLFPSGQATLSPSGLDVIKRLAAILNKNEYQVSVEGHSDPVPIQTRQFASNWELSSSRATSVLRELVRDGVAGSRLRAVGYAETRPIESNDTPAGRAANRRVELIMDITAPAKPARADAKGADGKPAAAAANGNAKPTDAKTADAKPAAAAPAPVAARPEAASAVSPLEAAPPSTLTPTEAMAATQS
ncbi:MULTISPECIES: OmpA/MotB family protein [Achromobacter]|jgi:chemotaxis protein MotB|uniref:Peptidoglycan-associated lipoprotein n=1 Tax=Achromobacter dolens TaxID=1287738 RepID=A0A6S7CJS9_9BURK|nr:OmpA family protein [Achromobacter dolens]CAB3834812.1 Peptidoglycan-associated lipoprotein [Achromobacter dolens]